MTKSSVVTSRKVPAGDVSARAGEFLVRAETIVVPTRGRTELIDLTERVTTFVHGCGVREGTLNLFPLHTTCAIFINETQTALHADILRFLEEAVSRDAEWMHNDPRHSDCDRMNADAHLRAMLLGHGLTIQIAAGEPVLGQWQRVLMAELDGPRERSLRLQAMGIA